MARTLIVVCLVAALLVAGCVENSPEPIEITEGIYGLIMYDPNTGADVYMLSYHEGGFHYTGTINTTFDPKVVEVNILSDGYIDGMKAYSIMEGRITNWEVPMVSVTTTILAPDGPINSTYIGIWSCDVDDINEDFRSSRVRAGLRLEMERTKEE